MHEQQLPGGQQVNDSEDDVTQGSSKVVVSDTTCRGCDFDGSSLRGHLARTAKNCKSLYTEYELKILQDKAEMKFVCNECNITFTRQDNFKRHMSAEHENKKVSCNLCSEEFTRQDNLKRHIYEVHEQMVRWKCDQCPVKVSRWVNLERHLNDVHDKDKRFKCPICEVFFARADILDRHVSDTHKGMKPFTCPECKHDFSRHNNLRRHIFDVHKKKMNYECDRCPEEFSRWENLERHLKRESHSTPYDCQFCHEEDLWFKSRNAARKHFLFGPRDRGESRSECAYSCVTYEKRKREERRKEEIDRLERERKKTQEMMERWADLPESQKEKERKIHWEEQVDYFRAKIDMWHEAGAISEDKKEGMLQRIIEYECNVSDEKMAMVMAKKWRTEPTFAERLTAQTPF